MADRYKVINHEEQYSIWPADRENPLGWKDAGRVGREADCLVVRGGGRRTVRRQSVLERGASRGAGGRVRDVH